MNAFIEKVARLSCWEKARSYCQVPPFQNNGEVMYAVIAAILIHGNGDQRWWKDLRLFAAQYNITFTR